MSRWEWEGKVPAKWTALKAPDLRNEPKERQVPAGIKTETSTPTWNEADLEFRYFRKELQDFMTHNPIMRTLQPTQIGDQTGPVTTPATAGNKLEAIKILMNYYRKRELFDKLKVIVGEKVTDPSTMAVPVGPNDIRRGSDDASESASAAGTKGEEARSPVEPICVGESGLEVLQAKSKVSRQKSTRAKAKKTSGAVSKPTTSPPHLVITTDNATTSADKMESYFQAAISRFLREQQISMPNLAARTLTNPGTKDVQMESAGSDELERLQWKYDPDDLDLPTSAPAAVATAAVGSSESTLIQRVRISVISELKEFTGKDQDEDRARAWISKVKSSFMRDQASDEEKCLTLADLLSGPAKNWYRQLPRSRRNKWTELLKSFQVQYCGFGLSVDRQYYQARKPSDESALEYLHRLNVAGLRARLKVKDGGTKERKEHVDHFIEKLGDVELADRLTLLRLSNADDLEEVLRALDRAKNRQKKTTAGSSRYRQKAAPSPAPAASAKQVHAIQIQAPDSESDSNSDGSDSDREEHRRIYSQQVTNTLRQERNRRPWIVNRRIVALRIPNPEIQDHDIKRMAWTGAGALTVAPRSTPIWDAGGV
ncbi:hypothetical protein PF005_g8852 [Phytophthora fragariae]|uniref:Retrotransposon gag domain-containing protein n=3 Tax=Phytophthora fragariae TaxID=53985 RepID=A0A6A3YDU7_9STRA|nr:hypothetical protein PF005_g8852 [Phytophthora fragariae]KAE9225202.1 hypothetical protein PF002_g14477 [Phytophthora fragariae]